MYSIKDDRDTLERKLRECEGKILEQRECIRLAAKSCPTEDLLNDRGFVEEMYRLVELSLTAKCLRNRIADTAKAVAAQSSAAVPVDRLTAKLDKALECIARGDEFDEAVFDFYGEYRTAYRTDAI